MSALEGWIKHSRGFLNWEWRSSPVHYSVFGYCLERANFVDQKFKGRVIKAGSFPTSHAEIAQKTGVTPRQARGALADLKRTGEIVTKSSRQGTVITVKNWNIYQSNGSQTVTQTADNQAVKCQENVRKMSTIKKVKKVRSNNIVENSSEDSFSGVSDFGKTVIEYYNKNAATLKIPQVKTLNPKRKKNLMLAVKQYNKISDWGAIFNAGLKIQKNLKASGSSWQVSFDYFIRPGKVDELYERGILHQQGD